MSECRAILNFPREIPVFWLRSLERKWFKNTSEDEKDACECILWVLNYMRVHARSFFEDLREFRYAHFARTQSMYTPIQRRRLVKWTDINSNWSYRQDKPSSYQRNTRPPLTLNSGPQVVQNLRNRKNAWDMGKNLAIRSLRNSVT